MNNQWIVFWTCMTFIPAFVMIPQQSNAQSKPRIGIFDSRAVALTYYNSESHVNEINELRTQFNAAKERGDSDEASKLERKGRMIQAMKHDHVFGKGSINGFSDILKGKIAEVIKSKNLIAVVSKWELIQPGDAIQLVDITPELVEFFKPNEKILKIVSEMKGVEPIKDALFLED